MKTKIILLLTVFFLNFHFAQEQKNDLKNQNKTDATTNKKCKVSDLTQIIEYDFSKGEVICMTKPLMQNMTTILRISNINRIFYKPVIQGNDVESNDPNLFENEKSSVVNKIEDYTIAKPESLTFASIFSTRDKANETNPDKNDGVIDNLQMTINDLKKEIVEKEQKINRMINSKIKIDSSITITVNQRTLIANEQKLIKVERDELDNLNTKLIEKNFEYANKILQVNTEKDLLTFLWNDLNNINKNYNKFYKSSIELQKIGRRYNNFIDKINRPDFDLNDFERLVDNKNDLEKTPILNPLKLTEYYIAISTFEDLYIDFIESYNNPNHQNLMMKMATFQNLKFYREFLEKDYARMKTSVIEIYKNVNSNNLSAKLNQVEILERELSQESTYVFTSDLIQGKGDYLEFTVDIKPKNDYIDALSVYQPRKFTISEYLKGGIRLDFGLGLSVDFNNYDEHYGIETSNLTNQKLTLLNDNKYLPKLVGMLHTSFRSSRNFALGLSLGTALDVANFDINSIYLGLSGLVGRRDKIILTVGPSFKSIKQIRNDFKQYTTGTVNLPANFQITEDIYTNNYKIGIFFAITYNLTNKQRGKFLQVSNP